MDSDLILWKHVQDGDIRAFEKLFKKFYPKLCIYAMKFLHDPDDARDAVQDLFVLLWENKTRLNIKSSLKAYLYSSVRYNAVRKKEKIEMLTEMTPDLSYENSDQIEFEELFDTILDAIGSLPERCRQIFVMSRFGLLSYPEIARKMNLSVKTIEAQISKALKIIQKSLEKNYPKIIVILFFFNHL